MLTILSLVLSGVIVYAVLVLLGRWIGFTLDLAGVAGFIVAIGITADSFVIFFERLKDEMREGRSFRSAVPRGWVRARRTILSADAVSFLAAAVLYILAVGQVKGFAFTLGMSTVLDLVVVFLVTHPLVALASQLAGVRQPGAVRPGFGGADRRRRAATAAVKGRADEEPRHGHSAARGRAVFSRLYTGTGAFDIVGAAQDLVRRCSALLVLVCVGVDRLPGLQPRHRLHRRHADPVPGRHGRGPGHGRAPCRRSTSEAHRPASPPSVQTVGHRRPARRC